MATTISHERTARKVRTKANIERIAYTFMRLSGIALLILAVGHVFLQLIFNNVHNLSINFVAEQWNSWGWKTYDMFLLIFAISHGVNGLRNVLEDYIHNRSLMKYINYALVIFVIATIIWAGIGIALFDASKFIG